MQWETYTLSHQINCLTQLFLYLSLFWHFRAIVYFQCVIFAADNFLKRILLYVLVCKRDLHMQNDDVIGLVIELLTQYLRLPLRLYNKIASGDGIVGLYKPSDLLVALP